MKRRDFLKTTSAAGVPFLLNGLGLSVLASPFAEDSFNGDDDRVLVLVNLNGGNDGLSTVLPLDQYSNLHIARSNILIPESSALLLTDKTGLHPVMTGMKELYDNGRLNIIQNVGYPDQNRSHFRSSDIWHSGSSSAEVWTSGWLGRFLDMKYPGYPANYPNPEFTDPFALTIGSFISETCQGPVTNFSLALNDPTSLLPLTVGSHSEEPDTPYGEELAFLRQTISQTNAYSSSITSAANNGNNLVPYPEENLMAEQLKTVAQLVSGGLRTKIYVVSMGLFDTHANQVEVGNPLIGNHAMLLKKLSDALAAFQQDLKMLGLEDRVIGMTYSEFGRRIRSNQSFGTDHGAAGPIMMFGSCINPGILGDNPEIPEEVGVPEGVALQFDFRDVYGSVLMDWFGLEEDQVKQLLYDGFQHLPIIQCEYPDTTIPPGALTGEVLMDCYPNPFRNTVVIRFYSGKERVRLSVFDTLGAEREVMFDKVLDECEHRYSYNGEHLGPGSYYFRLQFGDGRAKTRLVVKI